MPMSSHDAVFVEPAVSSSSSSVGGSTSSISRVGIAGGPQPPPPPHIVIDGTSLSTQAQLQRIMQRRMSISTRQILSASQGQTQSMVAVNATQKYAVRTAAGAGAGSSASSGQELINPQIYKIVTTDGSTSNVIIDASAAAPPHNSKLLLSNLTVLSKQAPVQGGGAAQQQQLSYMGAKSLPYVTASPAKQPLLQQQPQKFGSISAFKAQQQQQQHHPQAATLQKVTVGSRLSARLPSYVSATPPQIIVQPAQPKYVNATATTALGGNAALLKKANQKITVKSVGNMVQQQQQQQLHQQQQQLQAQQLKTFITQQQQQQQQTYKTAAGAKAKFVKQTTALSIAALPQQQQQQQQATYAKQSIVTPTPVTKVTKLNSKYVQQQQISLPQGTQLQHKTSPNAPGSAGDTSCRRRLRPLAAGPLSLSTRMAPSSSSIPSSSSHNRSASTTTAAGVATTNLPMRWPTPPDHR